MPNHHQAIVMILHRLGILQTIFNIIFLSEHKDKKSLKTAILTPSQQTTEATKARYTSSKTLIVIFSDKETFPVTGKICKTITIFIITFNTVTLLNHCYWLLSCLLNYYVFPSCQYRTESWTFKTYWGAFSSEQEKWRCKHGRTQVFFLLVVQLKTSSQDEVFVSSSFWEELRVIESRNPGTSMSG